MSAAGGARGGAAAFWASAIACFVAACAALGAVAADRAAQSWAPVTLRVTTTLPNGKTLNTSPTTRSNGGPGA